MRQVHSREGPYQIKDFGRSAAQYALIRAVVFLGMSTSAGRRKRAAPKAASISTPVIANAELHATKFATSLPIAVCRDAALAAAAARMPDPPLTAVAPVDVAEAVAIRMSTLLPQHIPHPKIVASLPVDAWEALVQRVASVALDAFALEWPRAMADERVRHAAAAERHQREADVAGQWNRRSRAVAVLGAPGMGYGFNVLPFLRRSLEGVAVHGASAELRGACHRTKWRLEVPHHFMNHECMLVSAIRLICRVASSPHWVAGHQGRVCVGGRFAWCRSRRIRRYLGGIELDP
jgi:hypothetical protein